MNCVSGRRRSFYRYFLEQCKGKVLFRPHVILSFLQYRRWPLEKSLVVPCPVQFSSYKTSMLCHFNYQHDAFLILLAQSSVQLRVSAERGAFSPLKTVQCPKVDPVWKEEEEEEVSVLAAKFGLLKGIL